jgi:hypothetical protein
MRDGQGEAPGDYWAMRLAELAGEVRRGEAGGGGGPAGLEAGVGAGAGAGAPGRVLRAKLGYNPNSSSVGSVVSVLMWSATFSAAALNALTVLLRARAKETRGTGGEGGGEPVGVVRAEGETL